MVVVGGIVVVVVGGGAVVVVVAGEVVVVAGAVVVVAGGCVVVVTGARVVGVVAAGGNRTEPGSVETFGESALEGVVVEVLFRGEAIVELVVGAPPRGVVVVLVNGFAGDNSAAISPSVWPRTLVGRLSSCAMTSKAAAAKRAIVAQPQCSHRC